MQCYHEWPEHEAGANCYGLRASVQRCCYCSNLRNSYVSRRPVQTDLPCVLKEGKMT